MKEKSGGHDISVSIYDGVAPDAEAERLQEAAIVADEVSLRHMAGASSVLDIGAGDSATLGIRCQGRGQRYCAVEPRSGAVATLRSAGLEAKEGTALDTGLPGASSDAVHARFVFGWLGEAERRLALQEMCRVLQESGTVTVIDYDWGVAAGPPEMMTLIQQGMGLLREQGFDPLWGRQLPEWLPSAFSEIAPDTIMRVEACDRQPLYIGELNKVLDDGFIGQTKESLVAALTQLGNHQLAQSIEVQYQRLCDYARQHPEEEVRLPDIVGVTLRVSDNPRHAERASMPELQEGKDYHIALSGAGWQVARATSGEMVAAIRHVQATAYVAHGLVSPSAIGEDGVLLREIEPYKQVERSVYAAAGNNEHALRAVMRFIAPGAEHLDSLPEVRRLDTGSQQELKDWLRREGVDHDRVIEVSGLAKNMSGGDVYDAVRVIVGLTRVARTMGYEAAVMGLREREVALIQGIFGKETIRCIGKPHLIMLPEVSSDIRYQTTVTDLRHFFANSLAHNERELGHSTAPAPLRLALVEAVQAAMRWDDKPMKSTGGGWPL